MSVRLADNGAGYPARISIGIPRRRQVELGLDLPVLSTLAVEVAGPVVHQLTAALEEVGSCIGSLCLVENVVRECGFDDLARMGGLFGGPITERRSEAVRHSRDSSLLQENRDGVDQGSSAGAWKYQIGQLWSVKKSFCITEYFECCEGQWYTMVAPGLHASSRNKPR